MARSYNKDELLRREQVIRREARRAAARRRDSSVKALRAGNTRELARIHRAS